jgi:transketolase
MINTQLLLPEWRTPKQLAIRAGVEVGLNSIARDERVVVLSADLAQSVKVQSFADTHPDRFIEVGVSEQNMAGVAAGLSFTGLIPFMASYAAFSPGRNWEQIRVSIALSRANVKIIGSHAGVSVGVNGPTHMGTEDIALMRVLPHMAVLSPADATQCAAAIEAAHQWDGPVYIRTTRPESAKFSKAVPFEIGKIYQYRSGEHLTIAACGIQVYDALLIAEELAKTGVECDVLNVSTIKPLDTDTLFASVRNTKRLVTIEDHQVAGGMGSTLVEFLSKEYPVPTLLLGIADRYGVSGSYVDVYKTVGLDRATLLGRIEAFMVEYGNEKL